MALIIRPATAADVPTIVEFSQRLARETENKSLDRQTVAAGVNAAIADPAKGPYYLAEENGEIVGQIQVTREWSDWRNGWFWWIQSVYVRADARRRGVFRALYHHVHQLALREPRVIGLRLYVERDNRPAQETYQRLGMQATHYLLLEKFPL